MIMTREKVEQINKALDGKTRTDIHIGECLGLSVIKQNMAFCGIEELTKVIEDLTVLRDVVTQETGIKF